jgi:integrase
LDSVKNVESNKIHNLHAAGESPLDSYLFVLPVKQTKKDYLIRLGYFFDYLQVTGNTIEDRAVKFLEQAQPDHKYAKDCLTGFVSYLKNDDARKLTGATIKNYFAAVKLFYEANAIGLNWKWIAKGLPPSSHVANDRAPTLEELRKLAEFPDRRIKVIVYVMASSGIRVGAWEYLKYKHITPLKDDQTGQVVAVVVLIPMLSL